MSSTVIDYKSLLREERKKAREQRLREQGKVKDEVSKTTSASSGEDAVSSLTNGDDDPNRAAPAAAKQEEATTISSSASLPTLYTKSWTFEIPAIDFAGLWQEERRKARQVTKTAQKFEAIATPATDSAEGEQEADESTQTNNNKQLMPRLDALLSQRNRLDAFPPTVYYVPNGLPNKDFQDRLAHWLWHALPHNPVASCSDPAASLGKWTTLQHAGRRVALFDKRLAPLPEPLATLARQLSRLDMFQRLQHEGMKEINHILVNDYPDTSDVGILPHTDGPAYEPCTATLSLGAAAVLHFTPRRQDAAAAADHSIRLDSGSLIVFCQEAYTEWMHSIPPAAANHGETGGGSRRLSLTFRIAR